MLKSYAKYVASMGLVFPCVINAVGLGSLNVESTLNQPLKAFIHLSLDDGTSLNGVNVRLASVDAFQHAGMERPYRLSRLKFKVALLKGEPVIVVSTQSRMNDPFLNVLLDVTWAKGQLYRSYTLLLDPPGYSMAEAAPSINKRTHKKVRHKKSSASQLKSKRAFNQSLSASGIYGPTKNTDDLWDIALRYKPENASINQVMVGLVRLNPNAFIQGNINKLKQGVTLKIPTADTIFLTSKQNAQQEVYAHMNALKTKDSIVHAIDLSVKSDELDAVSVTTPLQTEALNPITPKVTTKVERPLTQSLNALEAEPKLIPLNAKKSEDEAAKERVEVVQETSKPSQIQLTPQQPVKKEPLFDDFIPIPNVLKQIVKPHEAVTTQPKKTVDVALNANNNAIKSDGKNVLTDEVAVAVSAIESVRESNQLLRQQVETLSNQNTLLKQQLMLVSKQDETVRRNIDLLMKLVEKDYVVSANGTLIRKESVKQSSNATENGFDLTMFLSVLSFLILLSAGVGFGAMYLRQQRTKKVSAVLDDEVMALYNEDIEKAKVDVGSVEQDIKKESDLPSKTKPIKQYNEAVISAKQKADETFKQSLNQIDGPKKQAPTSRVKVNTAPRKEQINEHPLAPNPQPSSKKESAIGGEFDLLDIDFEDRTNEPAKKEDAKPSVKDAVPSTNEFDLLDIDFEDRTNEPAKKEDAKPSVKDAVPSTNEFDLLDIEFEDRTKESAKKEDAKPSVKDAVPSTNEFDLLGIEFEDRTKESAKKEDAKPSVKDAVPSTNEFDLLDIDFEDRTKEPAKKEDAKPSVKDAVPSTNEFDLLDIECEDGAKEPAKKEDAKPSVKDAVPSTNEFDLLDIDFEDRTKESAKKESDKPSVKEALVAEVASNVSMSTQVALAETYIAMEDWESAKESLEMVMKEGNHKQRAKAEELLKSVPNG